MFSAVGARGRRKLKMVEDFLESQKGGARVGMREVGWRQSGRGVVAVLKVSELECWDELRMRCL